MMNQIPSISTSLLGIGVLLAASCLLSGCGGEEPVKEVKKAAPRRRSLS